MWSLPYYQQEDRAVSLSAFPLLQVPTERAALVGIFIDHFPLVTGSSSVVVS